ncbi:N-acetyltransferase family protein [Pseudomonas sp. NPDC089569]|uniref:GNAT family N-acetyltransferase n=1 Tax=Pseudomonas sp. NPDC089569 TaxID=3390722 RepID=UPI003D076C54
MEKLTIRDAEPNDIDTITRFYVEEHPTRHSSELINRTIKFNIHQKQTTPPTHFLLACNKDKILALVILRYRRSLNAYEVEYITRKTHRHRGIAFHLIKFGMEKCITDGSFHFVANTSSSNTNSIKLLQKLQFKLNDSSLHSELNTYRFDSNSSKNDEKN